jgi:hypothetical protein
VKAFSSASDLKEVCGEAIMIIGYEHTNASGVKSLIGSNLCFMRPGLIACTATVVIISVYPSAGACSIISAAKSPAPPGLFSMMIGWPSFSPSFCESRRATTSVEPPGA